MKIIAMAIIYCYPLRFISNGLSLLPYDFIKKEKRLQFHRAPHSNDPYPMVQCAVVGGGGGRRRIEGLEF